MENKDGNSTHEQRSEALGKSVHEFSDKLAQKAANPKANAAIAGEDQVAAEEQWYARKAAEKQRGRQFKNDRLKQDMDLRKKHAKKAVRLAQGAIGAWLFFVLMTGSTNLMNNKPFLSDSGLITVTTGATVNVIAVFLVVVKGLFPPPVAKRQKSKPRRRIRSNTSTSQRGR